MSDCGFASSDGGAISSGDNAQDVAVEPSPAARIDGAEPIVVPQDARAAADTLDRGDRLQRDVQAGAAGRQVEVARVERGVHERERDDDEVERCVPGVIPCAERVRGAGAEPRLFGVAEARVGFDAGGRQTRPGVNRAMA